MRSIYKTTFWDYLIYIGAGIILVWALLKSFGVIHSPIWVDMIPYIGIGASLVGVGYRFGKMVEGIRVTDRKVNRLLEVGERFGKLEHEHNLVRGGKLRMGHPGRRV